jgi:hypothetical protein
MFLSRLGKQIDLAWTAAAWEASAAARKNAAAHTPAEHDEAAQSHLSEAEKSPDSVFAIPHKMAAQAHIEAAAAGRRAASPYNIGNHAKLKEAKLTARAQNKSRVLGRKQAGLIDYHENLVA